VDRVLQNRPYVLGGFTYADITVAAPLQFVAPVDRRFIPLSDSQRALWTDEELASQLASLVAWRDRLYAQRRPLPSAIVGP
jgi:glutathione S-transferase